MNKTLKSKKGLVPYSSVSGGFTLIEILIVMSIIGLLTSATLIGLGTFRGAGKDTRRIADLRQIQNILELYYAKEGEYPAGAGVDIGTLGFVGAGIGVSTLPSDPDDGTQAVTKYIYSTCGSGYVLKATLSDASNNKGIGSSCDATCGVDKTYCVSF
ncbi:type II secretion system GspH family protein [Patescibacteria group bacterium]|nr:type II secretion system GspH family protein [Patescibacteria group bacterium]